MARRRLKIDASVEVADCDEMCGSVEFIAASSGREVLRMRQSFLRSKILRFLLVGGLNTLVGFLVFSLAIYLSNGNIGLSLAANIGVGVFFNYVSYGLGVFRSLGKKQFAKFVLAYLFLYGLNYVALQFLARYHLNIYLAQFINIFYLAPLSYYIFNKWVFVKSIVVKS